MSDIRAQAIADCKYGLSLGNTTLRSHIGIWLLPFAGDGSAEDVEYQSTIKEIKEKLGSEECLLT